MERVLRIARIFIETPAIKTFRLMAPTGDPIPFDFLPGQFLTLTLDQDGKTIKRSYTMASSPTQRDYVELTIKREEPGVVSRYLHDRACEGDVLQVAAPQGTFIFTGIEAESIVLIGGGVGLTPLMSVTATSPTVGGPRIFTCSTAAAQPRILCFVRNWSTSNAGTRTCTSSPP